MPHTTLPLSLGALRALTFLGAYLPSSFCSIAGSIRGRNGVASGSKWGRFGVGFGPLFYINNIINNHNPMTYAPRPTQHHFSHPFHRRPLLLPSPLLRALLREL